MRIEYAVVRGGGRVVIPAGVRRRFKIEKETRIAFLEESGKLCVQPITDQFIAEMRGVLADLDLPADIKSERDFGCR